MLATLPHHTSQHESLPTYRTVKHRTEYFALRLRRPEVELPGGDALRHVSPAVQEGESQLDDLEQVHVAAQQLVLVVGARLEVSDRPTTDYYS